ncbi:hypothetical protein BSKO_07117 [Bryopsis sp. KO-2023]|nr:hypothetical protein BSKO_07117 [Bryopsis sp. KO-2023]
MGCDGPGATRGQQGNCSGPGGVVVEQRDKYSVFCSWRIGGYAKIRQRAIWSNYFEVGGYDCRLLIYPGGDSQAVPGYVSVYLQLTDPRHSGGKWECFSSYQLSIVNQKDISKSITRDSWHRYSAKKKSHGWCDFAPACTITDGNQGFAMNDTIMITADITVLNETSKFSRDDDPNQLSSSYVMSGTFNWRVHNFSLFMDMIKTQKIMSPTFPAGDCCLQMSVYQLTVEGTDYLSLCLESKDPDKSEVGERTCWSLFRISMLNQQAGQHRHRDSYGRFTADSESGDNTSLGWNEYMKMSEFTDESNGYLVDNTAVFQVTYHVLMEQSSFSRLLDRANGSMHLAKRKGSNFGGDHYQGKFVWKIENFTRLKEMLRKRKITGLCIKSRRFQVGGKDCRLIVYPRGQSQPPSSLSMFLEVTKRGNVDENWSCFVSHRLSVLSQASKSGVDRTVVKESQNRYSKTAKDWGWREFISLTSLFDQELGFLVSDGISFQAEVLVLKESFEKRDRASLPGASSLPPVAKDSSTSPSGFLWRMDNFAGFREVMETRKIYSQYFKVGDCSLRIGMYDSFDMLCVYLESENSGTDPEDSFWVRFRIAVINQKYPSLTHWKESSLCTRTWSNSVLQLLKVSQLMDPKAGYLQREGIQVACEVMDCSSWFEFGDSDLTVWEEITSTEDVGSSSSKRTALTTVNDVSDEESSEYNSKSDVEEMFQCVLSGQHGEDVAMPELDTSMLRASCSKFVGDAGAVSSFIAGLRHCLNDPAKVQRLVMPAQGGTSSSLLDLLLNIRGLATPLLDMLLDIMVDCALSIESHSQPQVSECANCTSENKDCPAASSNNPEEDPASRDPPSGSSTPMAHVPSFLGPAMGCLNGISSIPGSDRDCGANAESQGAQRDEMPHISPMIRFGTFAPGAVPGLDNGTRSRKAESRAWRVLGKLGSNQVFSTESSVTGDPPPAGGGTFMSPPAGCGPCLASRDQQNGARQTPNPPTGGGECMNVPARKEQRPPQTGKKGRGGTDTVVMQPPADHRAPVHAEVLALLVGALTSADFDHDDEESDEGSNEDGGGEGTSSVPPAASPTGSNLQKVSVLLSSAPVSLLPDIIMLVPMSARPSEHTAVAEILLGWLSEVGRRSPHIEQLVRPAVLSSLGPLKISAPVADRVVETALKALPVCPPAEVPAAVILILKLSSEHAGSGGTSIQGGVRGVRDFLRNNASGVSEDVFVAVQLAVMRHSQICDALLVDIMEECEQVRRQKPGEGSTSGEPAPTPRSLVDTMVLMDMLRSGDKREEVQSSMELCISAGLISSADVSTVLDRRRMYHKFWRDMDRLPNPEGGSSSQEACWVSEGSTGSEEETPSSSDTPISNDEFQMLLGLIEHLLKSKDKRVHDFLSKLYKFLFGLIGDSPVHQRLLQTLVSRAGSAGAYGREDGKLLDLLVGVVEKFPTCATTTVSMLIGELDGHAKALKTVREKVSNFEQEKAKLESRLKELSNKTGRERKELRSRISDLEGKLSRLGQEKKSDLQRVTSEKSELQDRVRSLEGQLDWMQAERNEERTRATQSASAVQDLQRQVREAEGQVTQLRKQKRDDGRWFNREKNSMNEKMSNLETEKRQLEGAMGKLKMELSQRSGEVAQRDKKVEELEKSCQEKDTEVAQVRATAETTASELRERQEYVVRLEGELGTQTQRCSRLEGSGLEELDIAQLQELSSTHERSMKLIGDILQRRGVVRPRPPPEEESQPILGLGISSGAAAQYLPSPPQHQWHGGFREPQQQSRPSLFRSGSDIPGYGREERLSPFPGVPPRGPDIPSVMSNSDFGRGHSKLGFGLDADSSMGLMRGPSEYTPTQNGGYPPRPLANDTFSGYHAQPPRTPAYDVSQHTPSPAPGSYLFANRSQDASWYGGRTPGGGGLSNTSNTTTGIQRDGLDGRPLNNGFVSGLFGSGSLTNGKRIW